MDISQDIPEPKAQLETTPSPPLGAALPCWEQWACATPTKALKVCSFPRDCPIHIQRSVLQEGFFPGFSYSQTANSTKSRMQAQSSASAMLWLHIAYTGATPGILTPLPKPAKGMREKLVAWKKRSNTWNYYQEQQKLLLYDADNMKHSPSNQITQESLGN